MDTANDYDRFRSLLGRLCETLGKPCTAELVESWWKALRNARFSDIERRVDDFLAKATESTKFPRPAQLRPPETTAPIVASDGVDWIRGYWRSCIVAMAAGLSGHTNATLEPLIVANKQTLGESMRALLDELDAWEKRVNERTGAMQELLLQRCLLIATEVVNHYEPGRSRPALVGEKARRHKNVPPPLGNTLPRAA